MESGQTLQGSLSDGWLAGKPDDPQKLKVPAVSKPNFASKYALELGSTLESSRRDLQNARLCTVLMGSVS